MIALSKYSTAFIDAVNRGFSLKEAVEHAEKKLSYKRVCKVERYQYFTFALSTYLKQPTHYKDVYFLEKLTKVKLSRKDAYLKTCIDNLFKKIFSQIEEKSFFSFLNESTLVVDLSLSYVSPSLFWEKITTFLKSDKVQSLVVKTQKEVTVIRRAVLETLVIKRPLSLDFSLKKLSLSSGLKPFVKERYFPQILLKEFLGIEGDCYLDGFEVCKMPSVEQADALFNAYLKGECIFCFSSITIDQITELEEKIGVKIVKKPCSFCNLPKKLKDLITQINKNKKKLKDCYLTLSTLLQIAPYLTYVDLRGIDLSKDGWDQLVVNFKKADHILINSEKLISLQLPEGVKKVSLAGCKKLESLSLPESVIELDCSRCFNLVTLNVSKNIEILNCSWCLKLESLFLSEGIRKVNCSGCSLLNRLCIPSTVKEVVCSWCDNLQTLTLAEGVKFLDCSYCKKLSSLLLPHTIQEVNCQRCEVLSALSVPERVKKLNCSDCVNLERLDLPKKIEKLNCSGCVQIEYLAEALECCMYLNCRNCTRITQLPQLPAGAQVYTDLRFSIFNVHLKDLYEDPVSVLYALGNHFLLKNEPFPNIHFIGCSGVDAGGLRRHFISTLLMRIVKDKRFFLQGETGALPYVKTEEGKALYQIIGRIFGFCFSHKAFLTGVCFDESLFKALFALRKSNLKDPLPSEKIIDIYKILKRYLWDVQSLDEATQSTLIKQAFEEGVVLATTAIAKEFFKVVSLEGTVHSALQLQMAIQGALVEKKRLKSGIKWELNGKEEVKCFLERWIDLQNDETLSRFVLFATGSRSLGEKKIVVRIYPNRNQQMLPIAHTCIQTIEFPAYLDFDLFQKKMDQALSSAESFQFT